MAPDLAAYIIISLGQKKKYLDLVFSFISSVDSEIKKINETRIYINLKHVRQLSTLKEKDYKSILKQKVLFNFGLKLSRYETNNFDLLYFRGLYKES